MSGTSRNAMQDILNRFHGSWLVTPETSANGQVVGCTAVLEQDVLPRGGVICDSRNVYVMKLQQPAPAAPISYFHWCANVSVFRHTKQAVTDSCFSALTNPYPLQAFL